MAKRKDKVDEFEKILCACGSGQWTNKYTVAGNKRKYIHGHNKSTLGMQMPQERKIKISITQKNKGVTPPKKYWIKKGDVPWNKKTESDIRKKLDGFGYFLLDEFFNDNQNRQVIIKDNYGYKYNVLLDNLNAGHRPPLASKFNPYTLENIFLWTKINNKSFVLTDKNIYINAIGQNLSFYCFVCKEIFVSSWNSILSGRGCAVCRGLQVKKTTSLGFLRPELAKEWSNKNKISSDNISVSSGKQFFWCCSTCNYVWKTSPHHREEGKGCPACAGKVVTDRNRLSLLFPELSSEWHLTKNIDLTPENISFGSEKKIWWKCIVCQYEWIMRVAERSNKGCGCPACAGKVVTDKNRLSIVFPELVNEWDFEKNKNIFPHDVSYGSNKLVWWLCKICENNWKTRVGARTVGGTSCPHCSKSKGEKRINLFLKKSKIFFFSQHKFPDCKMKNTLPYDFYIDKLNLCIEYNGEQHYMPVDFSGKGLRYAIEQYEKVKRSDIIKFDYCKNNNVSLLIIPYWESNNIENILKEYIGIR